MPELSWTDGVSGTKSYLIQLFDFTAHFTHLIIYNIDPSVKQIKEGNPDNIGTYGETDWEGTNGYSGGYGGPCPPDDGKTHEYAFIVYSMDKTFTSDPLPGTPQKFMDLATSPELGPNTASISFTRTFKQTSTTIEPTPTVTASPTATPTVTESPIATPLVTASPTATITTSPTPTSIPIETSTDLAIVSTSGQTTDAKLASQTSVNGEILADGAVVKSTDPIDLTARINFDSKEVNKQVSILVVALFNDTFFMKVTDEWKIWDGESIADIEAYKKEIVTTEASLQFEIISGLTDLKGLFQIFIGYKNSDNEIIYNTKPIQFEVE